MKKFVFFNTPQRKKVDFKTIVPNKVGLYSCGPTVYSSPHIGNMYAYVCWDLLVRSLRYVGYEVKWVMNITDVGHLVGDVDGGEDKMEKGSRLEGATVWDIAKKYTNEFEQSLTMLNIKKPDIMCKATDNIQEQIDLILKIEKNGFTYIIDDGVYFDTSKFVGYGNFAHLDIEKLKEGARVEVNDQKKNSSDFALWKTSPKDEKRQMEWPSPWGVGFPGWHIECTAMSVKYLGKIFDIHTGGEDHVPLHHTNEVAQSHGAWGISTANYWLHNAFITSDGKKISKSTGGLYTVSELKTKLGFDPVVYRYLAISTHYRRGMDFSIKSLEAAKNSISNIKNILVGAVEGGSILLEYKERFVEAICNDLSMSEAMAVVWEMLRSGAKSEDKLATWLDLDKVMGLELDLTQKNEEVPVEVAKLAQARFEAKKTKNWIESDKLRDKINEMGYSIEDTGDSYVVKRLVL